MNEWLQRKLVYLYSEFDGLKRPHVSGRSNVKFLAEVQGKLDACERLKDSHVDAGLIKKIRSLLSKEHGCKVEPGSIEFYRRGVNEFLDECEEKLTARE
jgi:hypothetical protein